MSKRIVSILICVSLLLCGCAAVETDAAAIVFADGQRLVTAQITALSGNEATFALASETTVSNEGRGGRGGMASGTDMPSDSGERPSGMPDMGDMPSGEMPDMDEMPSDMGEMPQTGDMPEMPDMSGANAAQEGGQTPEAQAQETAETVMYTLTGETWTTLIPVGATVTTQLGATTTFARLAVGDMVKMAVQQDGSGNDIIAAIWIVG